MFLTLTIIFGLGVYDVIMGELDSFNSMILNIHEMHEDASPEELAQAFKQQRVLAFGIDNPAIDASYLKVTAQHVIGKNFMNMGNQMYNCSKQIYGNLNPSMKGIVPANLRIICLNVSAYDLDRGVQPAILFSTCVNTKKSKLDLKGKSKEKGSKESSEKAKKEGRCKPWSEIQRSLRRLDIWAFTLADSTNYASPVNEQKYRYTASKIPVSYKYQKMACLTLRSMKIESKEGAFFQQTRVTSTAAYLSDEQEITTSYEENEVLQLSLKMDRNSQVLIKKKYKSIFSLFAYVGGLSKGIAIFFAILIFPVREVLYYQNLINNMFNVCLDHEQKEIALKTMFADNGQDQDDNDDGDSPGEEAGKGSMAGRKESRRRTTEKGFYKKMMFRKKTSSKNSKGGLFDDFTDIIAGLSSDQIFNNMVKAMSHPDAQKIMGADGFSNLLMKGLNIEESTKKKRKKRLQTQPPGVLPTGEYRDLNDAEKTFMDSEMVKLKLKNWLIKARTKALQKHLKKVEEDKEKLNISMASHRKKRIMKMLTSNLSKKEKESDQASMKSSVYLEPPAGRGVLSFHRRNLKKGSTVSENAKFNKIEASLRMESMDSALHSPINVGESALVTLRVPDKLSPRVKPSNNLEGKEGEISADPSITQKNNQVKSKEVIKLA